MSDAIKGVTKLQTKRREEHCYKWLAKGEKGTQNVNFFFLNPL